MTDGLLTYSQLQHELEAARQHITRLEDEIAASNERQLMLEEAVQRYSTLFEHSGDSLLLTDLATGQIVEANTNAARRLGYEVDELTGLTLDDVEMLPTMDNNASGYAWQSSFTNTFVYECLYRHKDGSLIPVEVSSRTVKIGQHDFQQHVVRDNTRRKQTEAEREQLIAELNAFAHTVAHDLKSPLAIVSGYAEMLLAGYHLDPEKTEKALAIMGRMSRKMSAIVDEMLLLASTRNLADISLTPLSMEAVVQESLARLSALIQQRRAQVVLPENGWLPACGYAPWIEEVWVNYLSNAIKYGGAPPILELGAAVTPEGMIRFWVRDNGAGVSPEKLPLLFSQFQRLGETQLDGHGLGLSIVQRIITRLGGEVGVESNNGQGSTFYFTLPEKRSCASETAVA